MLEPPQKGSPAALLESHFGAGQQHSIVSVPGRINLIGEHIDYHSLPVLPMAIQRHVSIAFRPRNDGLVRAVSRGYGDREFTLGVPLELGAPGDWSNYLKAAAQAAATGWNLKRGIDAGIMSDLPAAAGLASSSALLTGFTLALLRANGLQPTLDELMEVLPEGEHFVGTRGGGMDHAAVLASQTGCALLVRFDPLEMSSIAVPAGWLLLIAHSMATAEKSGGVRAEYNARRAAGLTALSKLRLASYRDAIQQFSRAELLEMTGRSALSEDERQSFLHVITEAFRLNDALDAMRTGDARRFGALLNDSHASLRDRLRVSSPGLDEIVTIANDAGAFGARLTGAGFGGCAIVLTTAENREHIAAELVKSFYAKHASFHPQTHLFSAEASAGALGGAC